MSKLVINGFFLTQQITGIQRYAREMLAELDKIAPDDADGKYEVIVPEYADNLPQYRNLKYVKYGAAKGYLWEQTSLATYLRKNRAKSLNLCNNAPFLRSGPTVIHDISYKVNKSYFTTLYGFCSMLYWRLQYRVNTNSGEKLLTVSAHSKKQIVDVYNVNSARISVIPNAWQHIQTIDEDESIFENSDHLTKGEYYFTLGSLAKNKNLRWVLETARRNPNGIFVIAGGKVKNYREKGVLTNLDNIVYTGYISDGQVKAYMKNCKAFLFPSFYEGFGIPPLEALASGCRHIIISNTSCLPEIYGDCAHYIDPCDYGVDLDKLLEEPIAPASVVLEKYSWEKSAGQLYEVIREGEL